MTVWRVRRAKVAGFRVRGNDGLGRFSRYPRASFSETSTSRDSQLANSRFPIPNHSICFKYPSPPIYRICRWIAPARRCTYAPGLAML
ncbi:hypothetical protein [Lysobacter gummosus]|uniref:hypothetical protein n=1 Tax=Lysobacter gummosus TaxID=262324 RepID=UPI00362BDB73